MPKCMDYNSDVKTWCARCLLADPRDGGSCDRQGRPPRGLPRPAAAPSEWLARLRHFIVSGAARYPDRPDEVLAADAEIYADQVATLPPLSDEQP